MKTAMVVMTIMGCGHGEQACDYLRTVDTVWSSPAACEAQAASELKASADLNYPNVVAVCTTRKPPADVAEQAPLPSFSGDVVIRRAGIVDSIRDSLPDVDDARAAISRLVSLTRDGTRQVLGRIW